LEILRLNKHKSEVHQYYYIALFKLWHSNKTNTHFRVCSLNSHDVFNSQQHPSFYKWANIVATINILIYESNSHHLGNGSQKCVKLSSEAQTAWCVSL